MISVSLPDPLTDLMAGCSLKTHRERRKEGSRGVEGGVGMEVCGNEGGVGRGEGGVRGGS